MNIDTRIRRRQDDAGLVRDEATISPVSHIADPVGRGPTFEALLDYLDPVLDGALPPDAYVWGPAGAGKSAVVTALFAHLRPRRSRRGSIVHTATRPRAARERSQSFVYVDARAATTDFARYHAILDGVVDESVPTQGVRTDALLDRLRDTLCRSSRRAVVAVDHVGESETCSLSALEAALAPLDGALAWVAIGRDRPTDLDGDPPATRFEVPAYETRTLADVVTTRAMAGLDARALTHQQCRDLAAWADGDAHDALAALFAAADRASERGRARVEDDDIAHACEATPRHAVPLSQVLTLAPNRQRVLRELLDVRPADRSSVEETAAAIAAGVDLSAGTVRRYLYELADDGIVERVRTDGSTSGRPPSRVEPRFPTSVFRRLYEAETQG
ncbi:AAA family ATPase [Haloarcula onubensis]|uniref:AAA family ATPase n=1 Tax=Haloarcula onubensis TaxID=2950539 RepID=A0ABU2FSV8_9EURY|nr:AAA family ATPase [Halomicroarcula sp. S3CR25-11]MDS0283331.1 AAA family ATPase [Halomicroarcula sp. S3CR25-11]